MTVSKKNTTTLKETPDPWQRHRRLVRVGQVLMAVGGGIALVHWLTHLEVFGSTQPPLWLDFVAGYPAGGLVFILGAMLAGRKRPTTSQRKA